MKNKGTLYVFREFCYFLIGFLIFFDANGQNIKFENEVDTITIPCVDNKKIWGISGIEYIANDKTWHLVNDRGNYLIFENIIELKDFLNEKNLSTLTNGFNSKENWFEAVRYYEKDNIYFYSIENDNMTSVVFKKANENKVHTIKNWRLGIDMPSNRGVEAIALCPNGDLWIAPEVDWQRNSGDVAETSFIRIRKPTDESLKTEKSFIYNRTTGLCSNQRVGVSEILALNDSTLLVLERCYREYNNNNKKNQVMAFLQEVSIKGDKLVKKCVFDFNSKFYDPDNLEGMALVTSENGEKSIVIISDDNFNKSYRCNDTNQRTFIIKLKLKY